MPALFARKITVGTPGDVLAMVGQVDVLLVPWEFVYHPSFVGQLAGGTPDQFILTLTGTDAAVGIIAPGEAQVQLYLKAQPPAALRSTWPEPLTYVVAIAQAVERALLHPVKIIIMDSRQRAPERSN